MFVAKGAGLADLEAVVQKLRYLFNQDPLVNLADGDENSFAAGRASRHGDPRTPKGSGRAPAPAALDGARSRIEPLDPRRLALVEQASTPPT